MQCNIDQRGRQARVVTGLLVDFVGVGLLVAGLVRDSPALWMAGAGLMTAGSLIVLEGVKGWCVLRALGVKTRL